MKAGDPGSDWACKLTLRRPAMANGTARLAVLGLGTECVVEALEGGPLISPWEAGKCRRIEDVTVVTRVLER
jgi:hypothetical protein